MYQFKINVEKEEFNQFVENHEYCNLLQSYQWANIKQYWDHYHTGVYEDGKLVGVGLVLIKELPMKFTMFYIPRGPILDYKNQELLSFYFNELKKVAKKRHCLFIKFDPAIHINDYKSKNQNKNYYKDTQYYLDSFKKLGAKHHGYTMYIEDTIQPRFQSNVYACENIEENLPKHTKRLIKDADRRNVKIIHGQKELIDEFSRLVELTEQRKNVSLRNKEYFTLLMNEYPEGGVIFLAQCNLYQLSKEAHAKEEELLKEIQETPENAKKKLRRLNDQLNSAQKDIKEFDEMLDEFGHEDKEISIAGILSVQFGNTCEMLYAGMDERFKKFMPQYKEYVENFKWAFDRECIYSNMGGVEGTLDDGLTKFKDNFDPTINEFIGEFDLPVNKLLFKPSLWAYEKMKKRIKS
ncbi:peptidoglycan bridge formation glycyltransferase FemA/FemB family protein [Floccifex sp.]|uniref:peptidoglycan bridge formation glycyltransferase FemA/FemB family protein n=1 Tax=Floccifex sp. TaxID=2815810 RepID=UPI002A758FE5|nr:peptidoglycan bridge formation glycyltransferase FemA/FemB family protein [Floccifex sp.]MDD7280561.1 peptidoglycan bridge formation glycyltransferase FemA/FemB family protein [Erysipelotrichaceae bacterium]MDY2958628.1 peptidoglycan bridge formation glycyltransferase FemA/FemB family protein [Floccifex sp.]